jgi:hypothetical protein
MCVQTVGIEVADGIVAAPALAGPPLSGGGRVQQSNRGRDAGREPKTRRHYTMSWLSALLNEDTTSGKCIFGTGVRDMIIIVLLY